jgi:hypothetical protein
MPRYIVERTFPTRLEIPIANGGAEKKTTFCVCDAPTPEAIQATAAANDLSVDRITQVRVLDPYFNTGKGV